MSTYKDAIKELLDEYNRLVDVIHTLMEKKSLSIDLEPLIGSVREMRSKLEAEYWGPPSAVDRPVAYSQT